jgi:hypothetical protein
MFHIADYHGFSISVSLRGAYYIIKLDELADMGIPWRELLVSPSELGERAASLTAQDFIDEMIKERGLH